MDTEPLAREFDLLSLAESCAVVTTRDDQYEFPWLLDAAHISRRRGGRFRLVDSGKNDIVFLTWLAEAGAHIYTSDETRPDPLEIIPVLISGRRSGAFTIYYIRGPLNEDPARVAFLAAAVELGRAGADFHISNRQFRREAGPLLDLALACARGGGRLVYYHHGRLEAFLEDAAGEGAWIHWSDQGLDPDQDRFLLRDILAAGRAAGAGLILHLEDSWPAVLLGELRAAGAYFEFHTAPAERTSDRAALEERCAGRRPDFRSYYLHAEFLP